jgi:hypothetical protein
MVAVRDTFILALVVGTWNSVFGMSTMWTLSKCTICQILKCFIQNMFLLVEFFVLYNALCIFLFYVSIQEYSFSIFQHAYLNLFLILHWSCYCILFDTSLESDSVSIVTSEWRFLFCSLHFRSSFFTHWFSFPRKLFQFLQTDFLRRYGNKTKYSTRDLRPLSFTWIESSTTLRNSRERKFCVLHSYYK